MVAGWDDLHHMDPRSTKDYILQGFNIDHEKFRDDIVRIGTDRERDRAKGSSLVPIKPIQTEFEN